MKALRAIIHTTLFALLSVGCASILGIEDAELKTSGAGGTSGTGGSNGSGGSAGGANQDTPCAVYCETVMENCTGDQIVYPNVQVCLDLCVTLPEGDSNSSEGNTVACRQAVADAAEDDPDQHCPVAGLGGGDVCGNNCTAFCGAMLETCPGEYASNAACLDDCDSLEDLGGFDFVRDEQGPTVQCRIWHVGAATEVTDPHCAHAAGARPCIENP